MKFAELLGFHGVVVFTDRLEQDARLWSKALAVPILRRSARAITLGSGPEFFLELRQARRGEPVGRREVHVAVRGLSVADGRRDALGGVSARRTVGDTTLVLREFIGPSARDLRPASRRKQR